MINKETVKRVINNKFDELEDKTSKIIDILEKSPNRIQKEINKVKKLFDLKSTDFIIDPNTQSRCVTLSEETENVVCVLSSIEDAVHEGVHAFFEERAQKLWDKLGESEWKRSVSYIVTISAIEEITARIIELNVAGKTIDICSKNVRDIIDRDFVSGHYANKRLGKEINQIKSIYDFYCIKLEEMELYNKLKNKIDPIEVYNILSERVGAPKLIKK